MSRADAEATGFASDYGTHMADVLARALATVRRAGGGRDTGRLRLPVDLLAFPPDLWAPLSVIHRLDDGLSAARDDGRLANALRRIVRWCAARGEHETALAIAESSAALHPALPSPALLAAWVAFEAGRPAHAQRWLAEAMARAALASTVTAARPPSSPRRDLPWETSTVRNDAPAMRRAAVA